MMAGAPAGAQMQSDSYKFLKAVRDQDALKAKELFDRPGSTIVNSRDYSTGESALHIVVKRRDVAWINFPFDGGANLARRDAEGRPTPIGSGSCRDSVVQDEWVFVVAGHLNNTT